MNGSRSVGRRSASPDATRAGRAQRLARRGFRQLNKALVPLLSSPAGAWVASPLTGYMAVLVTTGRRTGQQRRTTLNYVIRDGSVYLLAGFDGHTDWLANLRDHPHVELRLPGRTLGGLAEVVTDEAEALDAAVAVGRNAGVAILLDGVGPAGLTDAALREHLAGRPVVRVTALPSRGRRAGGGGVDTVVAPTGHDPGGHLWLLPHVVAPAAAYTGWRLLRRALRS